MEQTPLYYPPGKKRSNLSIFRNCRCAYYARCLEKAAYEDLFLDCKECHLKDSCVEVFTLDPYRHAPIS